MPRLASGQYSRTRRPRPSEKTAPSVIPGFAPLGRPSSDGPPRGGAGSARPQGRHHAKPNAASFGHHALANEPVTVTCPGSRPARIRGRGDRAPPRKPPPALSPGFPPQGHPSLDGPPRGGAGSARPQCRHHAKPNAASFGHHALANEPMTVTCPGSRPALPRGRTECVPPRRPPLALSPGLPR
jgi:hypothetical protein